jgi:hypothetical protein
MAAVAVVAINLGVIRAFTGFVGDVFPLVFFACGVVPMASLLLTLAALRVPGLIRGATLTPFILGFEAFGWVAVFGFITCYSLVPTRLVALIADFRGPKIINHFTVVRAIGK